MMSSENQEPRGEKRFSHISVGDTAADKSSVPTFEDEEVFEIGPLPGRGDAPRTAGAGEPAGGSRPTPERDVPLRQGGGARVSKPQGRERGERPLDHTGDDPDYGIDDLPPMSLMQKVVLFVLIVVLLVVGAWLFNFYTGGSI